MEVGGSVYVWGCGGGGVGWECGACVWGGWVWTVCVWCVCVCGWGVGGGAWGSLGLLDRIVSES